MTASTNASGGGAGLAIPVTRLDELNAYLDAPDAGLLADLRAVVAKYGTPVEINRKARAAGQLPALLERVRAAAPQHLEALA